MKIVYSFNKKGYEADYWAREIAAASTPDVQFIPFNHDPFLPIAAYVRAQLLDNLWYEKNEGLLAMYRELEQVLERHHPDALLVDNCFPYHPDYLRRLSIYKVLRTSDGPMAAYDRDFAYLHAYDQVLYHSPAYSSDLSMVEKLRYCGHENVDFWPLGLFDRNYLPEKSETELMDQPRDIDVIFIGAMYVNKMPLFARAMKTFGRRFRIHGLTTFKKNLYFNARFGWPGWIRPVRFEEYVTLYQRSKIGINIHNRGKFTVGNYRLFDLPANGVMQISDGEEDLERFFKVGDEVEGYRNPDEMIEKIHYYLQNDGERRRVAVNGHRRVLRDYRIGELLRDAAKLIARGMSRSDHGRSFGIAE